MKYTKKVTAIIMTMVLIIVMTGMVHAAQGTCEIFFFTGNYVTTPRNGADAEDDLEQMGYTVYRYGDTDAYYVRRTMDSDVIFAMMGEGGPGYMTCASGTQISAWADNYNDNNYSLAAWFSSNALSGMKLAYYGASQSALSSSVYGNLPSYTTSTLGATCAIGFESTLTTGTTSVYESYLFDYLRKGETISGANRGAQGVAKTLQGSFGGTDSSVIYGNGSITIN